MRNTRSVNAKSALRREERAERVRAGNPSPKLDYRCPICNGWFSRYRNRHGIHIAHCRRKQARRIVEQRERNKARIPLPPPDPFTPEPSSVSRSPTPVPAIPAAIEEDQQIPIDDAPQQPEDVLVPPVLDEPMAWLGDVDPGKYGIFRC